MGTEGPLNCDKPAEENTLDKSIYLLSGSSPWKLFELNTANEIVSNWEKILLIVEDLQNSNWDFNVRVSNSYKCQWRSEGYLNIHNYTLLHKATSIDHTGWIRKLVGSCGAKIDDLTGEGYSTLIIACLLRNYRVIKCLLSCNANVELKCVRPYFANLIPKHSSTILDSCVMVSPLMLAIENGDLKMTQILVTEGNAKVKGEDIRHCLRTGQLALTNFLLDYLPADISFEEDEISNLPSIQFFINNYNWVFNDTFNKLITIYEERGYKVCKSDSSVQSILHCFLRNSFARTDTAGFDFIMSKEDVDINVSHCGNLALSTVFSSQSIGGPACCWGKFPCCRYYLQYFVRECADMQLYTMDNFIYHHDHLDVLNLLYKTGAVFPRDFESKTIICAFRCGEFDEDILHDKENQRALNKKEFISFCKVLEENRKKLQPLSFLARLAVRKLPNVREIVTPVNIGLPFYNFITFKEECDEMETKAYCGGCYCDYEDRIDPDV